MQRQWGPYHNQPPKYIPPQFPPKFPFQSSSYQSNQQPFEMSTPYDFFQKPPIPMGSFGQQQGGNNMGMASMNKGVNPFIQQFQDQNGQLNFDKLLSTVGQMVNTVNQVSPLVKQVGSLIKGFK